MTKTFFRKSRQAPYLQSDNDNSNNSNSNSLNGNFSEVRKSGGNSKGNINKNDDPKKNGAESGTSGRGAGGFVVVDANEEADAAAGGSPSSSSTYVRVSSFSLLPRSTSTDTFRSSNSAARTGTLLTGPVATGSPTMNISQQNHQLELTNERQQRRRQRKAGQQESSTADADALAGRKIQPDWRLRDRMKTVGVGLIMALNVGTDPPDITKPHPCAVLQCWIDPRSISRAKAKELIGERLEQQYAKWQLARTARPLKYRRALDPTVEDVRALCLQLRRQARNERILLHYNGHGVPRPTANGEIWVFDKNHTEYIPLPISDLRQWLGKPSIVVLDCSAAGILAPFWMAPVGGGSGGDSDVPSSSEQDATNAKKRNAKDNNSSSGSGSTSAVVDMDQQASQCVRDTIVLCPCSENEWLPMHPDYPADIFTSCLTTPIPIALRWFVRHNASGSMSGLHPDAVDAIPGKANDRKTPLGELNWIFTAVTDSIAWNILPKPLFQRLFRQDLLVASMFRNFLLADRILRSLGCTPISYPPLPPNVADHPLWRAWDLACETLLFQLRKDGILGNHVLAVATPKQNGLEGSNNTNDEDNKRDGTGDNGNGESSSSDPTAAVATPSPVLKPPIVKPATAGSTGSSSSISSPFFSEQLTAFEVWLDLASIHKTKLFESPPPTLESPEQLPVVLQVLLSQVHRIRALRLLRRFLELGPWAVNLALSLGIFPYVMKLLQSPEYKSLLVSIWASIFAFDTSCRVDLLKDGAFSHFVGHLVYGIGNPVVDVAEAAKERTLAAFVLAAACFEYPEGQAECVRLDLHGNCYALLSSYEQGEDNDQDNDAVELHLPAHFRLWLCLCLANMTKDNISAQNEAYGTDLHSRLYIRMNDKNTDVRAAVCYALGCLIGSVPKQDNQTQQQQQPKSRRVPLVPQRVVLPGGLAAATAIPGMQPPSRPFGGNPAMVPNLQWRPHQTLEPMPPHMPAAGGGGGGGQSAATVRHAAPVAQQRGPPSQPLVQTATGQFLNQPAPTVRHQLHTNTSTVSQHGQPPSIQTPQYVVHHPRGQPLATHPAGFFVGSNPVVSQGVPPALMATSPQLHHHRHPSHHQHLNPTETTASNRPLSQPSVYDDLRRLDLDLASMECLSKIGLNDASAVVRYEATLALASAIGKYLEAFVAVAEELSISTTGQPAAKEQQSNRESASKGIPVLKGLDRKLLDRFATIWKNLRSLQRDDPFPAISNAANAVARFVHEHVLRFRVERATSEKPDDGRLLSNDHRTASFLGGIDEELETATAEFDALSPPAKLIMKTPQNAQKTVPQRSDLRRVSSEVVTGNAGAASMEQKALLSAHEVDQKERSLLDLMNYSLPQSRYYEWKKNSFDTTFEVLEEEEESADMDPLSPTGAYFLYQERRNFVAREQGQKLALRYASLAPKPPQPKKKGYEFILEEEDEDALLAAEEEASGKKAELELEEKRLLRNDGVKMTAMINFHSYEDILMACGDSDSVSLWDTGGGNRVVNFVNGNPKGSRMTSSLWINEESTSLFLVGCDDGSVRIWDRLLESNGRPCKKPPTLASAFYAAPMVPGKHGSGLICEWQQWSGNLLAGGNSQYVRCWDLESEKQVNQLDAKVNAYVTTLTTAWDSEQDGTGHQGIGKDVVVAGHSDGTIKIFDLRTNRVENNLRKRPRRQTQYCEHTSWVVGTSFNCYGGSHELISGTLAGEIKAWDLRMSASVRTHEVQRSLMTTLAVHSKIPVVATGSHYQFIKILTLDGDTLQVLRYHEKMAGHRIGPVSCLAFHRYKPLLAAGATDTFIGLYTPRKK